MDPDELTQAKSISWAKTSNVFQDEGAEFVADPHRAYELPREHCRHELPA